LKQKEKLELKRSEQEENLIINYAIIERRFLEEEKLKNTHVPNLITPNEKETKWKGKDKFKYKSSDIDSSTVEEELPTFNCNEVNSLMTELVSSEEVVKYAVDTGQSAPPLGAISSSKNGLFYMPNPSNLDVFQFGGEKVSW
jgi:hypothetical protein